MSIMISAIGVSYLLQNLVLYVTGGLNKVYPTIPWISESVSVFGATTRMVTLVTPVLVIVLVVLLVLLINHTKVGMAMRAVSKDFETSQLMGVKINSVISVTFIIGSFLAAIGSILYFTNYNTVIQTSGAMPGLKAFVAAVFGGIGSVPGAVVGAFIIGICESIIKGLDVILLQAGLTTQMLGLSTFSDAFTFALLIVILIVKPTGLFGEKTTTRSKEARIMQKTLAPDRRRADAATWITVAIIAAVYIAVSIRISILPPPLPMLFTVLKKGATYALVAVSMNLLNGFTGLFSLGQAGFMLIGGYTYAIFSLTNEARETVYQYFDCAIGVTLGVVPSLILAGLVAALFAFLIGLPVLRLKSDYLAIATLGFAEIIRAVFQWQKLGPVTNGSNMLKDYPTFNDFRHHARKRQDALPFHADSLRHRRRVHRHRGIADQFQLRPRLQGHPRRRGGRRGHGHQPGAPQAAFLLHQLLLRRRGRGDAGHVLQHHTGQGLHLGDDV